MPAASLPHSVEALRQRAIGRDRLLPQDRLPASVGEAAEVAVRRLGLITQTCRTTSSPREDCATRPRPRPARPERQFEEDGRLGGTRRRWTRTTPCGRRPRSRPAPPPHPAAGGCSHGHCEMTVEVASGGGDRVRGALGKEVKERLLLAGGQLPRRRRVRGVGAPGEAPSSHAGRRALLDKHLRSASS